MSAEELQEQKERIEARLSEIEIKHPAPKRKRPPANASVNQVLDVNDPDALVPYQPKSIDTHWDYVMKEMMWLGADFGTERKRQMSSAKRMAASVRQFHKTKEARRQRALAAAEQKRRRLAGRIGRDVKGWWTKIERVVAYKQKLHADEERQVAMNRQLVRLVRQTERYSESLARQQQAEDTDSGSDSDGSVSDEQIHGGRVSSGGSLGGIKKRRKRRRTHSLSIEEALAMPDTTSRRSKYCIRDYSRVDLGDEANEFYAAGSDSDASFSSASVSDDETTMREAEQDEIIERYRRSAEILKSATKNTLTFVADPHELQKLQEEANMPVEEVLMRFKSEQQVSAENDEGSGIENAPKRVKFADFPDVGGKRRASPTHAQGAAGENTSGLLSASSGSMDTGSDADDDGDASDVEDFVAMDTDGDDEFVATETLIDDETTIEQEEAMPQDMSAEDEIRLLNEENEMSIEELRKRYASMDEGNDEVDGVDEEENQDSQKENLSQMEHIEEKASSDGRNEVLRLPNTDIPEKEDEGEDASDDSMVGEDIAEDYRPVGNEVDDETTIEIEEKLGRDMSYEDEIALLNEEKDVSVEELRRRYCGVASDDEEAEERDPKEDKSSESRPQFAAAGSDSTQGTADDKSSLRSIPDKNRLDSSPESLESPDLFAAFVDTSVREDTFLNDEEEFEPEADAVDDETTIAAEERLGREMSVEDEIELLQKESEMSIEDLLKTYGDKDRNADQSLDSDEVPSTKRKRADGTGDDESGSASNTDEDDISASNTEYSQTPDAHTSEDQSDDGARAMSVLEASAERARNTLATRPYLLAPWVKLREYQQIGLNWLVSLQSRRLNGILADEMGLGKTLQTISMLAYLASYRGIWGPHLVIVPTSVIINWETELKRFCPALKVLCYYGSAKERKELRIGWTQSNWYHVVITSYQLAVQDAFAFKRKRWYYMILDEAQNIKNFQSQRWQTLISFNTQRRLLLTGTPLQNNLMELWSLLHFLMPYVFRSRKEFSYWFSNPMNNMIEGNTDRNEGVISRLHGIIRPFVLRRLKKDVATQMPGKYEHIVKCQLSRRQMTLYEEYLARSTTRVALKKGGNFMGMMNVLMQLRKVCNHPDLFEPRSVVTPFAMPRISYRAPRQALFADEGYQPLPNEKDEVASPRILSFLWTGSCGLPSMEASLRHGKVDCIELTRSVAELLRAAGESHAKLINDINEDHPPELVAMMKHVKRKREVEKADRVQFCSWINVQRCRSAPFPYADDLLDAVRVQCSPFDCREPVETRGQKVILTPAHLLAARKDVKRRAMDVDDLVDKFVFCVPKAEARPIDLNVRISPSRLMRPLATSSLKKMLLEPIEEYCKPFRKAQTLLSSFFPNKKLIQFDSGKLQTLAELLRDLKQGGHRALIFCQMSKMLDIVEAFLNFNGHTYLRLDGSTGVERRQRYMDRFNNDPKIFCFILSTRSGGLGINLTGADTVIFYDSDWNPAMDAQAQDRAHRIGQTRDVHIYRLILEHTIEENILLKARQKRNLDIMVMDGGKFDASQLSNKPDSNKSIENDERNSDVRDVYTKGGLRAILGVNESDQVEDEDETGHSENKEESNMSKEQMEIAMASLEDDDDVKALQGAQKEAAEELKEFEESNESKDKTGKTTTKGSTNPSSGQQLKKQKDQVNKLTPVKDEKSEELDMEKEFAAWQSTIGLDASAIQASLSPMERYGLNFREEIDPFYSVFYMNDYNERLEMAEGEENIDIDEIEREKATEESRAMDDGNLLATRPKPEALIRQRNLYRRERARLKAEKKHRKLTGEDWTMRYDEVSKRPYFYNTDTGEAVWQKPGVLAELEADRLAHEEGWHALPDKILVHVMKFILPSPDRARCAGVCRNWRRTATDIHWVMHVYPVEMGGLSRSRGQREKNHYGSISEALSVALPGDTIELSDGHYWMNDEQLSVPFPVRLVGDEYNPANVIVETSGTLLWRGRAGWIEGVTFRRPKIASGNMPSHSLLTIEDTGRVDTLNCVFDNEGSFGPAVATKGSGKKGIWNGTVIQSSGKDCILNFGDGKILGRFKGNQKRAPGTKRRASPGSPPRSHARTKIDEENQKSPSKSN